jgi:hypothetical protein
MTVAVGGIKEVDAAVKSAMNDAAGLVYVERFYVAEVVATETDFRDFQLRIPQSAPVHLQSLRR